MDPINGDGVLRARNKETMLYGLYQHTGENTTELIAAVYDSIYFFPWNGNVTAVFKDGKVGFHNDPWSFEDAKETVPCVFEDYEFVVKEQGGIRYLAVKREDKWAWWDWINNEAKSEWYTGSRENLPYPHYEQARW